MPVIGDLVLERRPFLRVLLAIERAVEEDGRRRSLLLRYAGGKLVVEAAGNEGAFPALGRWPEQVRIAAWSADAFVTALATDPFVRIRVADGFLEFGMQLLPCDVLLRRRRLPPEDLDLTTGALLRLGALLPVEEQLDLGILEEVEEARATLLDVLREGVRLRYPEPGIRSDLEDAARFLVDPWSRSPRPRPVVREPYPPPSSWKEAFAGFPSSSRR